MKKKILSIQSQIPLLYIENILNIHTNTKQISLISLLKFVYPHILMPGGFCHCDSPSRSFIPNFLLLLKSKLEVWNYRTFEKVAMSALSLLYNRNANTQHLYFPILYISLCTSSFFLRIDNSLSHIFHSVSTIKWRKTIFQKKTKHI